MPTLLEKLCNITEEMGALTKGGRNEHFNYDYVKGETAMLEFRKLEVKHRIKVIPVIQGEPKTENGLTTFVVSYNIHDLDSKEFVSTVIPVQGYDKQDKGVYQALTGGFKYFLLQTFSASSDDPEKDTGSTQTSPSKPRGSSVRAEQPQKDTGGQKELQNAIYARMSVLVEAGDRKDLLQMVSEWRVDGVVKKDGVIEVADLNYKVNPGKSKSQAEVIYGILEKLTADEAYIQLDNWRNS